MSYRQSRPERAIRVAIVDDEKIVLYGITCLLSRQKDIEVVGAWCSVDQAIEQILVTLPDVVVLELQMGNQSGFEVARAVDGRAPAVRFVCLSGYLNPEYIGGALAIGAHGYVQKGSDPHLLVQAVRRAASAKRTWCKEAANIAAELEGEGGCLSAQERHVLRLIAAGSPLSEAAKSLGIDRSTAKTALHRAERKLKIGVAPQGYRARR